MVSRKVNYGIIAAVFVGILLVWLIVGQLRSNSGDLAGQAYGTIDSGYIPKMSTNSYYKNYADFTVNPPRYESIYFSQPMLSGADVDLSWSGQTYSSSGRVSVTVRGIGKALKLASGKTFSSVTYADCASVKTSTAQNIILYNNARTTAQYVASGCIFDGVNTIVKVELRDGKLYYQYLVPLAVCGNSVVESGEECDDSNTANGDGCTSSCQLLCVDPSGINAEVKETVKGYGGSPLTYLERTDSCSSSTQVTEFVCDQTGKHFLAAANVVSCAAGKTCVDGACIAQSLPSNVTNTTTPMNNTNTTELVLTVTGPLPDTARIGTQYCLSGYDSQGFTLGQVSCEIDVQLTAGQKYSYSTTNTNMWKIPETLNLVGPLPAGLKWQKQCYGNTRCDGGEEFMVSTTGTYRLYTYTVR